MSARDRRRRDHAAGLHGRRHRLVGVLLGREPPGRWFPMTDMQILATAVASLTCAQSCALMVGWLADREDAVHQSWADGVAWYRTRRAQAARLSRAWLLAVLRAVLPAHGKRRAGVA